MSLSLNYKHHYYTNYLSSVNFHIIVDSCDLLDQYGIMTIIVDNYWLLWPLLLIFIDYYDHYCW